MPQTSALDVATEVRVAMARSRCSQSKVAAVLGLSQQAVSRRLKGDIPFDVVELYKLADYFGVPVTSFLAAA